MSVSLTTQPPSFAFSSDLITARFTCQNYLSQPGVRAINQVAIGSAAITLKYGQREIVMTPVAEPDQSGNQFRSDDPLRYFKSNPYLNEDFEISFESNGIRLVAKKAALGYNIAGYNQTPGQPEKVKPNYSVKFKLFCQTADHSAYEEIYSTQLLLLPGQSGAAEAPIGDKLNDYIMRDLREQYLDTPSGNSIQCTKSCRAYYFEFAEQYGLTPKTYRVTQSGNFTVLQGGLSYIAQFNSTLQSLLNPGPVSADRFLKQGNNAIYTRSNQPQYLYFFNTRGNASVELEVRIRYKDGSTSSHRIYGRDVQQYCKYAYDVSFDTVVAALTNSEKAVDRYEVQLFSGGAPRSETRTYHLNYEYRPYARYFLYWSSFGSLDSKLCYGQGSTEFELNQKEASRMLHHGYDIRQGNAHAYDLTGRSNFKVATGWMTKRELIGNRDFFLSPFKYRFAKGMLLPIRVDSKTIPEIKDGEHLLAQEFAYSYQFDDHSWTEGDDDDSGLTSGDFFFNSAPAIIPGAPRSENDPTVPSWVKSITQGDINKWNAGTTGGGLNPGGSYPGLDGSGAYGVWNIDISGNASTSDYALDSAKWAGNDFSDYLNQSVRTDDEVRFKSISSKAFVGGFAGEGWQIDEFGNATVDSLTVRKELNVYELVLNKISGTNGALAVTDTIKIQSVVNENGNYTCFIDTAENTVIVPFRQNDLVRCQVWNGKSIKYYFAKVLTIANNGGSFVLEGSSKVGAGIPEANDVVVRFGNTNNTARQGLLYLTSSDQDSPYLDVLDGVNSDDLRGKTKARLGKLDGITDEHWGQLSGYGLYAKQAYLTDAYFKGRVEVTGGNAETKDGAQQKADKAFDDAKELSDAAKEQAVLAIQRIEKITDDGILDVTEKQRLRQDFEIIYNEKDSVLAQAQKYSINTSNYLDKWSILTSYLVNVWLADMHADTAIDRVFVDQTFVNYYNARQVIRDQATIVAKGLIDKIQAGGNNLVINSNFYKGIDGWYTNMDPGLAMVTVDGKNALAVSSSTNGQGIFRPLSKPIEPNTDYTISFEIRGALYHGLGLALGVEGSPVQYLFTVPNNTTWTRMFMTVNSGSYSGSNNFVIYNSSNAVMNYYIREIQVAKGTDRDWSAAPEDLQDQIKTSLANTADVLQRINEFVSDGILDPSEKQSNLKDFRSIQAEISSITGQAAPYGIPTTEYTNRYNELESYLAPLFANMNINSDIDRNTHILRFTNYVNARQKLLQLVSDAPKGLIEKIEVGGINMLNDSTFERGIITGAEGTATGRFIGPGSSTNAGDAKFGKNILYLDGWGDIYLNLRETYFTTTVGKEYTISFWSKCAGPITQSSSYYNNNVPGNDYHVLNFDNSTNNWVRNVHTFKAQSGGVSFLRFGFLSSGYAWLAIDGIKIEAGNKATDWTPSPGDIQGQYDASLQAAITAQGDATRALSQLNNITSDGVLDVSEKQGLRRQLDTIYGELASIRDAAAIYGIDTLPYTNSWGGITHLLMNVWLADMTVDTPIDRTYVNSAFADYYLKRQALAQATTNAAKALADKAQTTADNVNFGGVNMLKSSSEFFDGAYWLNAQVGGNFTDGSVCLFTDNPASRPLQYSEPVPLKPNTIYTYSAWLYSELGYSGTAQDIQPLHYWLGNAPDQSNYGSGTIAYDQYVPGLGWKAYYVTFRTPDVGGTVYMRPYVYLNVGAPNGSRLYATHLQLSEETKPTPYKKSAFQIAREQQVKMKAELDKLGSLAYSDFVEKAKLGKTIMSDGGYIQTVLLEVEAIWAKIINAGYITAQQIEALQIKVSNLQAVSGTIGGLAIADNSLTSSNGNFSLTGGGHIKLNSGEIGGFSISQGYMQGVNGDTMGGRFVLNPSGGYIAFVNDATGSFAGFGSNVVSVVAGIKILARWENVESNPGGLNIAMRAAASGAAQNIAIDVPKGGARLQGSMYHKVTVVSADGYVCTEQDYMIYINGGSASNGVLYLPVDGRTEGRTIRVKNAHFLGKNIYGVSSSAATLASGAQMDFVFTGGNWVAF